MPGFLLGALLLGGCASNHPAQQQPQSIPTSESQRQLDEGYSLLYGVLKKNSDVDKILIFKHTNDTVGNVIREVAKTCSVATERMDEFPKTDSQLNYNVKDLPALEQKARDLEAVEDRHMLLTSSGKDFEENLIFDEAQAMDYIKQLCDALQGVEQNVVRKNFLKNLSNHVNDLNGKLLGMLTVKD